MNQPPLALRYAVIAAFFASNAIVIVGDRLRLPMPIGITAALGLVGVLGYLLHCNYTFRVVPSWLGFGRYLPTMDANPPLSILWIWLFADAIGWPLAAPLSSACMLAINFLASRWAFYEPWGPAFVAERS